MQRKDASEMKNLLFMLSDIYMEESDEVIEPENPSQLFGDICLNRLQGIAYNNIKKLKNLYLIDTYSKNLEVLYKDNIRKSQYFKKSIVYLSKILENASFNYSLLKGAYLTTKLYEPGYRTSKDVDILVHESDITACQNLLKSEGFTQGSIRNGKIVEATRKEVVMSRMNYGEVIPFVKEIDGEYFCVDINFSVDYKPDDGDIVARLLENVICIEYEDTKFKTLDPVHFLIHLCCHLYKEATTMDWVLRRKDLQLYKFCDINLYMNEVMNESLSKDLIGRIHELQLEKACYYTFKNLSIIYPNILKIEWYSDLLHSIRPENTEFMTEIVSPLEKKTYYYDISFEEWFDLLDRKKALKLKRDSIN